MSNFSSSFLQSMSIPSIKHLFAKLQNFIFLTKLSFSSFYVFQYMCNLVKIDVLIFLILLFFSEIDPILTLILLESRKKNLSKAILFQQSEGKPLLALFTTEVLLLPFVVLRHDRVRSFLNFDFLACIFERLNQEVE